MRALVVRVCWFGVVGLVHVETPGGEVLAQLVHGVLTFGIADSVIGIECLAHAFKRNDADADCLLGFALKFPLINTSAFPQLNTHGHPDTPGTGQGCS